MTRIPYPDESELDDDAREVLASLPPLNVMRMFAGAPASLRPMADLGRAILLQAELDPRLRELAILAVGRACGSTYEQTQHENLSRALGIPDEEIAAVVEGRFEELDDEARLVVSFADEIARNVGASEERDGRGARAAGPPAGDRAGRLLRLLLGGRQDHRDVRRGARGQVADGRADRRRRRALQRRLS